MLLGNHVKVKPKEQNFCVPSLKQNILPSFFFLSLPLPSFSIKKTTIKSCLGTYFLFCLFSDFELTQKPLSPVWTMNERVVGQYLTFGKTKLRH